MLPYLALALYIVSLIVSLILMLMAKRKTTEKASPPGKWFKASVFLHLLFLLLFFADPLFLGAQIRDSMPFNLSFLFYFCTGTALCGWAMRLTIPLFAKIYFILFDASLVLFIIMPFSFSVFLLSGKFTEPNEVKFPVNDHYYIMEQGNVSKQTEYPIYRVVKHRGMFNQTVQYNLNFGGMLDSIHLISIVNDKSANIRAYIKNIAKQNSVDSLDVEIKLKHEAKDEIQRQM